MGGWLIVLLVNMARRSSEDAEWLRRMLRKETFAIIRASRFPKKIRMKLKELADRRESPALWSDPPLSELLDFGVSSNILSMLMAASPEMLYRENREHYPHNWATAWINYRQYAGKQHDASALADRLRRMVPEKQLAKRLRRLGWRFSDEVDGMAGE